MSVPSHFVIRTGGSNWRDYVPLLTVDFTTNLQSWNPDSQYNNVNVAPHNEIAQQFSYFAAYWLNRNKVAVNGSLNVTVYPSGGTFYFQATTANPVTSYQGLYSPVNGSYLDLTVQQDGINAGRASNSYTTIPSGPRTLLNYISSFGITGSSSNDNSTKWNSGHDTLTLTHVNTYDNYFSRNTRVKIIQGDGSVDGPDWAVFNFDIDNGSGDFHGNSGNYSYFGGESSSGSNSNGGSGGLTITHGFIWGWANDKWNKLFQMELSGNGGLFNNSFAGWWASGNTVTSGNGKYSAYDTLSISHIGFSVQYTSSTLATLAPLALKVTATLTASQTIFYQKFVSGASISFNVISSNAGSVSRTHESNDAAVVTIPTASTPSASIAGPGKTTIKVTQPATTTYTEVINNDLITIVVIGQGKTYTSETFPDSFDLSGANLSGSIFNSCNLTGADLYNTVVNASTSLSTSTLASIKSGRITGVTSFLPAGYIMI
jgi:hypothetical protein